MGKILNIEQVIDVAKNLHDQGKTVVLAGGCFDILHSGHINFLKEAKKKGDILILLLESDKKIKKIKGKNRPLNSQKNRSIVLSGLSTVNYIIPLKGVTNGNFYDKLIVQIKPAYIAITVGDKNLKKRVEQCRFVNAKLVKIRKFNSLSSSNYIENV